MNGSTKILTVSYGTFSATLEGFDDPLGSMREIAEYFRDLASDDRYFGAEPPTPDVEMLQKIAENEVRRRVEARVSDSGTVALVASEERVAPEPTAEAPRKTPAAERQAPTSGPLTYDDEFLMADEPEDVLSVDPHAEADASGPAENVAEKLRRIRAVVSKSVELEDKSALRREQAPNADDPAKRDRALSETIRQIESDIEDEADEEDHDEVASSSDESRRDAEAIPAVAREAELEVPEDDVSGHEEPDTEFEPAPEHDYDEEAAYAFSPEPEEDDVGRLLEETDHKLNEDDTVRRRRVISQMRAAVAATKADRLVTRSVSQEMAQEAEKAPYRADLSEAVEDDVYDEADERPRSTPLVLVSSQRIDSVTPDVSPADFAAFVASTGARALPELIEAAAAFTVFSEGQKSFTRPEIMKRVARVDPTLKLSREESLRSFGQLLRQGTFRKLERGQFTIDKGTRFNPDQRAASR